ncbi:MAG: hypothetical protein ACXWNK_04555 [Vulcanimicrobiaceae bacterium]
MATPAPSAVAQAAATPKPAGIAKPAAPPNPFAFSGYFRGYYFTRQNASGYANTFKAINQASFNPGVSLHGQYTFENSPITIGGSYFYANPFNDCTTPQSHLSLPCGKHAFNGQQPVPTNFDDTLPGFEMSTLYEAFLQYKDPTIYAKLGNQVVNTPWANPSDSRLKPVAFQGGDLSYKFNNAWTGEVMYMDRFESRASSNFDNSTLLTSHPVDAPGAASNIYTPGGGPITTSGFGYGRLGYTAASSVLNLQYYGFADIANAFWLDGKQTWSSAYAKPFVAVQFGAESNTGSEVIGKISSTAFGVQGGITPWKNVDLAVSYNYVPQHTDTVVLPAGVSCGANNQIKVGPGVTFPYFLPSGGTPNCHKNGNGTTDVYYGGWASPYTDSYATDPFFTTSISQGMVDRRSPGQGVKVAATWQTADHRFKFIASRAWYQYGNATAGVAPTQETDLDGTFFFKRPGKGAYHGLMLRERYAERTQAFTQSFGGAPLFKYNRTQLEFDF